MKWSNEKVAEFKLQRQITRRILTRLGGKGMVVEFVGRVEEGRQEGRNPGWISIGR